MSKNIIITNHFRTRFKERQAKTKRIESFASEARDFGKKLNEIKASQLAQQLAVAEKVHDSQVYVYKNFCYWFCGPKAITIYPLPTKYRGKI